MNLDAIIIADIGVDTVSVSNPLRLKLDDRTADIQVALNYYENGGRLSGPIEGDELSAWSSALMLNGIYLYSFLSQRNFNIELINNFYVEKNIFTELLKKSPRAIIISTTLIYRKQDLCKLVDDIRSLAPDAFIIVGGPFVYTSYKILSRSSEEKFSTESIKDDFLFFYKNEPQVDLYIVSLKGEEILCDALSRIRQNKSTDDLPNTAYMDNKRYVFAKRIDDISVTGKSFSIDWQSLPAKMFHSGVIPMQASVGCNYRCSFCNFVKDRRLAYIKPLDDLIAEIRCVVNRGIRYVWFTDDNFRLGGNDLNHVCRRFIEENLGIQWLSFVRANTLKDVDVELLRRSGCSEVRIGLESADPQILKNMNKETNPGLYSEIIRKLLAAGINCSCYFIFGFPGETEETVKHTINFIKNVEHPELEGIFSWSLYPFLLVPLSPVYESDARNKYGLTGYMNNWSHKTMNSQVVKHFIKKAFFEIDNSSPIYRGDNQDILYNLSAKKRKEFVINRHRMGKMAATGRLSQDDILRTLAKTFSK